MYIEQVVSDHIEAGGYSCSVRGAKILGVYEEKGRGKTTLCKCLCNHLNVEYGGKVCYVEFGSTLSRLDLQKKVLKELTDLNDEVLRTITDRDQVNTLREDIRERSKFLWFCSTREDSTCSVSCAKIRLPQVRAAGSIFWTHSLNYTLHVRFVPTGYLQSQIRMIDCKECILFGWTEDKLMLMQGWKVLRERLPRCKVFLALDNVRDDAVSREEALSYLSLVNAESMVVVTARSLDVLTDKLKICPSACVRVPDLTLDEAINVFLQVAAPGCSFSSFKEDERCFIRKCVTRATVPSCNTLGATFTPLKLKGFGAQMCIYMADPEKREQGLALLDLQYSNSDEVQHSINSSVAETSFVLLVWLVSQSISSILEFCLYIFFQTHDYLHLNLLFCNVGPRPPIQKTFAW